MNLFASVLAVISVAVFFTNIPNYMHVYYGTLVPYQWVLGFGVLSLPLLLQRACKSNVLGAPVVGWCFLYILVSILWFIPSSQDDVAWQEVRSRALTVIQLIMFLILFTPASTNKLVRHAVAAGVILGVALNIYELIVPLSFSPIIGRSAGLYINPTTSSFALVGGMILALTVLPYWSRGIFVLIVGIGVVITFSRGGIIAWCVASLGLVVAKQIAPKDVFRAVLVGSLFLSLFIFSQGEEFLETLNRTGVINANVEERLLWLTDPSGVQDQSSWARAYVAKRLWNKWAEHPFLGSGTGAAFGAFEIPPHNQYLMFMVDHGLMGVILFPLLILLVISGSRGDARVPIMLFGGMQALAGLMSHTLLTEPQTLLLFAMAATVHAGEAEEPYAGYTSLEQKSFIPQTA